MVEEEAWMNACMKGRSAKSGEESKQRRNGAEGVRKKKSLSTNEERRVIKVKLRITTSKRRMRVGI